MTRSFISKAILALALTYSLLPAQTANPVAPKLKGKKEQAAVMALFQAYQSQDFDGTIKAADDLLTKFTESDFRATACMMAAESYRRKGDEEQSLVYSEKTLEYDPKYFSAQIAIATALASRTKEFDLDKEDKLGRAEKLAKGALELIPTAPKPNAQLADDQWEASKKDFMAQAHEALGLAAMVRKNYQVCADEFKASTELSPTPDPAGLIRQASCLVSQKKYDDALPVLDKALAQPNASPQVKGIAANLKVAIAKEKAKTAGQ